MFQYRMYRIRIRHRTYRVNSFRAFRSYKFHRTNGIRETSNTSEDNTEPGQVVQPSLQHESTSKDWVNIDY